MAGYGVVRLDKVRSVYHGNIFSVVNNSGTLQNGQVCTIGALVAGERELRTAVQPTANIGGLALIAHPEITYQQFRTIDNALNNFIIDQGKPTRAYDLQKYDIFSVSTDVVTGTADTVTNKYVVAQAGFNLKAQASVTGTEGFQGNVIAIESIGVNNFTTGQNGLQQRVTTFVVIEVVKN
jgi:hypothetical protein